MVVLPQEIIQGVNLRLISWGNHKEFIKPCSKVLRIQLLLWKVVSAYQKKGL